MSDYDEGSERGEEQDYGSEPGSPQGYESETDTKKHPKSMKDIERTGAQGLIGGTGGAGTRSAQTEEDKFLQEMNTILTANAGTYYRELRDADIEERLNFFASVRDMPDVERYNAEMIVAALYYIKYVKLPMTKENIAEFKTQFTDAEEKIDLVRYIRMLSSM
uniref:Uncharacterized protein n=1 Tax=viral metagenome TaxID=1070528 RepID=A0A6C0M1G0_9ZZZZ